MSTLVGQTVAVVGASSGIGLAVARLAASRGARVVMLSRSRERLQAAARNVQADAPNGAAVLAQPMDMLDRAAVDTLIGSLEAVDHLVLTAVADELGSRAPITQLTNEQVERTFDKLRGFVNVVRAAAPKLPARARSPS